MNWWTRADNSLLNILEEAIIKQLTWSTILNEKILAMGLAMGLEVTVNGGTLPCPRYAPMPLQDLP